MQVRYRYRLYPSPGQQQALARAFGCARVVYNDCLRLRDACHSAGEKISDTEVQRRVITVAKLTPERSWLGEVASVALVQACQEARRLNACGTGVRPPTRVAAGAEAGTHRSVA
jgi:putative transposase